MPSVTDLARTLFALVLLVGASVVLAQGTVPEVRFTVTGFTVTGENPLSQQRTADVLASYTGEYTGLDGLLAAADALEQALAADGHGFHRVALPPQTLEGGTVTLKVVRFTLGMVHVEGNEHFSAQDVRDSLPVLVPGETPETPRIARAVAVANRHPAKSLAVTMRQGETPDTVDAVVRVRDRRPWTVFALLNNMGSPDTGRSRLSVGAQHSNLFGLDHVLTASATRSPQDFGGVEQYGFSYQVPFYPWSGWLTVSGVYSNVDTGVVAQSVDVSGSGTFWAASFRQELARVGALRHAWTVSVQDRRFDDSSVIPGFNVCLAAVRNGVNANCVTRSRPLELRWDGEYVREAGNVRGYAAFAQNIGSGRYNDDFHYGLARFGAKDSWNALRFGVDATQALPSGWLAHARIDGQWAGETLIPGEQFGVGGMQSVRGFEERAVAGDNGVTGSLEIWAPPIGAVPGLRVLGFVDAGWKQLERPLIFEEAVDTLVSVGVGARYQWRENLSMSLDYGHVLEQARGPTIDAGNNRWHLSVLYRY